MLTHTDGPDLRRKCQVRTHPLSPCHQVFTTYNGHVEIRAPATSGKICRDPAYLEDRRAQNDYIVWLDSSYLSSMAFSHGFRYQSEKEQLILLPRSKNSPFFETASSHKQRRDESNSTQKERAKCSWTNEHPVNQRPDVFISGSHFE